MNTFRGFLSLLILLIIAGCSSTSILKHALINPLSQQENDYLAKADQQPLTFRVPKTEEKEIWSRAQRFLTTFQGCPISLVTDVVIQTDPYCSSYGYSLNKSAEPDSLLLIVKCTSKGWLHESDAEVNAHIFAYAIKSGVFPPTDRLVQ